MIGALVALMLWQSPSFEELAKRAQAAQQADRVEEAVAAYRQALKLRPNWAEGWWGLGTLEYLQDKFTNCRDALGQLTRLDSDAPAAWALLGVCEYKAGLYGPAGEHLFRARSGPKGKSDLSRQADFYYA